MDENTNKKEHWVERTVLDSFTKLTHNADKERVKAGCELIKHLSQDGTDEEVSKECKYALERLIRGLGSSRVLARSGFFIALVALLTNNKSIDANMVLEVIQKELQSSGSDSKSEKGDINMGKILGCGALLRSGSADRCTPGILKSIIEIISQSANKKSYLTPVAYAFLIDFINKTSPELFTSSIWPVLKTEVAKHWKEQSINTIHLLYVTHKKFPDVVKQKFIKKNLEVDDILCAESMPHIAEILMNTLRLTTLKHPFYELFCTDLCGTECIVPFWHEVEKYLSKSDNKEIIATTILTYLVTNMQKLSIIPDLLTGNYLQTLFQHLKLVHTNLKHELNVKNINLFSTLAEKVSDENVKAKTKLKVIKSLLLYPGDLSFEKITGTKTIQKITASLDCEGVKKLAAFYRDIILANISKNNPKFPNWTIYERVYAAQLFSKLLNFNCVSGEQEWKIEQIKFLMNLGVFISNDGENVSNDQEITIGSAIAQAIKECFYGVLAYKQKNLDDLRQLLSALIDHSNNIISDNASAVPLRNPFSEDDLKCWNAMSDFITKLKAIDSKEKNIKVKKIISVFQILSIHMGFQLFKDPEMARGSLQELQTCFERFRVLGSQKHKKRKSLKEGEEVNDEPEWMEVVVDLILSILSRESHLLRSVISCIFPHLCPYLNSTVIHQILAVLDPKSEENPLSRFGETDSEDSDDDSENEDKTEEASENDEKADEDQEDEEEELSEGSDPESDDCENDTATDKLRMAITQALGNSSDQESIDLDDIDEEEGKRLDKALGEAFKIMKKSSSKKSKKQSKTDKSLTNFRTRVLDLLLIYLSNEPSMYICLEIMLPLFQILEFALTDTHQNPLQNKVQSCIRSLCNVKKFSTTEGVTEELLFELLSSLLNNDATSTINIARNKENADCCTFIVRCSIIINQGENSKPLKNDLPPLVGLYKDQLSAFFTRRDNHLPVTFFSNVLSIVWSGNWTLIPICLEQAFNTEIRAFRRALGFKLLQVFYQNYRSLNTTSKRAVKTLKKIETDLSSNITSLATTDEVSKNEHYFQQLITLLTFIKKYHKMDNCSIPDLMDWDAVKKAVISLRQNIKISHNTKSLFNKFCAMLDIKHKDIVLKVNGHDKTDEDESPAKKPKLEENGINHDSDSEENDEDEEGKSKKESKKRQKVKALKQDKLKLKKEAKLLRLQASEGMESVSFSNVNIDNVENGDEDDDDNTSQEDDKNESQDDSEEEVIEEPTPKKKKRRISTVE